MLRINKIDLNNFRCYEKSSFSFEKGINIIVGNNATGKTSLVEAIYLLGMCKSFRTSTDNDLVRNNETYYCVSGNVESNFNHNIVISYSSEGKKISKDGEIFKSLSDYLGEIIIVSFTPDDLKLIKGEPKHRRRFLDINLGQINKKYLNILMNYNKTLKERNEYLKSIDLSSESNNFELLSILDGLLIKYGKEIISLRRKFIEDLNQYIEENVLKITFSKETGKIVYHPNVSEDEFEKTLKSKHNYDLITKTTSCGPHRDDFVVLINGFNAQTYGSQGQQRTLSLGIKLGLADLIRSNEKDIIVILDDVFGELDENRQKDLIKLLGEKSQTFITTTNISQIDKKVLEKANIIQL